VFPSVLSLCDLKQHKTYEAKNVVIPEILIPRLTFDPRLASTWFISFNANA